MKAKAGDESKAVAYLRVSTDGQELGPDAQRKAIEAWARGRGVAVVAVFEDHGISGAAELDKRPGLLAAVDALKTYGAGALVVAKRDRLARDVIAAAMIERLAARNGARVLSTGGEGEGDDPASQLMRTMIDAFAAYERALIAQRTRAALAVKRERGEHCGGDVPFGYAIAADGRTLDTNETEQAAIAQVRELHAAGKSLRAIARELTARGLKPRRGAWHVQKIANVVNAKRRVA